MLLSVCMQCVWTVCLFAAVRRARLWATCAVLLLLHVLHVRCLEELEPVSLCYKKKTKIQKNISYRYGRHGAWCSVTVAIRWLSATFIVGPLLELAGDYCCCHFALLRKPHTCFSNISIYKWYLGECRNHTIAGLVELVRLCVCVCCKRDSTIYGAKSAPTDTHLWKWAVCVSRALYRPANDIHTHTLPHGHTLSFRVPSCIIDQYIHYWLDINGNVLLFFFFYSHIFVFYLVPLLRLLLPNPSLYFYFIFDILFNPGSRWPGDACRHHNRSAEMLVTRARSHDQPQ